MGLGLGLGARRILEQQQKIFRRSYSIQQAAYLKQKKKKARGRISAQRLILTYREGTICQEMHDRRFIIDDESWGGSRRMIQQQHPGDEEDASRDTNSNERSKNDHLAHSLPYVKRTKMSYVTQLGGDHNILMTINPKQEEEEEDMEDHEQHLDECVSSSNDVSHMMMMMDDDQQRQRRRRILVHRSMENITQYISTNQGRVRPPVDVIATYVNTSDKRALKKDLLQAQLRLDHRRAKSSSSSSSSKNTHNGPPAPSPGRLSSPVPGGNKKTVADDDEGRGNKKTVALDDALDLLFVSTEHDDVSMEGVSTIDDDESKHPQPESGSQGNDDHDEVETQPPNPNALSMMMNNMKFNNGPLSNREPSGEWGWFADIDSSCESIVGHFESTAVTALPSMRRAFSNSQIQSSESAGEPRVLGSRASTNHVLCNESENTRITAAHKTFAWHEESSDDLMTLLTADETHDDDDDVRPLVVVVDPQERHLSAQAQAPPRKPVSSQNTKTKTKTKKIVSAACSIPKFRIVQSKTGADRHAEYLVTFKLGTSYYADWRRYSEFQAITKIVDVALFPRTHVVWKQIDTRWFNRLEPSYLHRKCIALEGFVRELMYESLDPSILLSFLGGDAGKINNAKPAVEPGLEKRPGPVTEDLDGRVHRLTTTTSSRPSAQLPKDLRPPQPAKEREMMEKLWAENFKRSMVPDA